MNLESGHGPHNIICIPLIVRLAMLALSEETVIMYRQLMPSLSSRFLHVRILMEDLTPSHEMNSIALDL
jgi:hypothetical protein